jgi:hypothetical protein
LTLHNRMDIPIEVAQLELNHGLLASIIIPPHETRTLLVFLNVELNNHSSSSSSSSSTEKENIQGKENFPQNLIWQAKDRRGQLVLDQNTTYDYSIYESQPISTEMDTDKSHKDAVMEDIIIKRMKETFTSISMYEIQSSMGKITHNLSQVETSLSTLNKHSLISIINGKIMDTRDTVKVTAGAFFGISISASIVSTEQATEDIGDIEVKLCFLDVYDRAGAWTESQRQSQSHARVDTNVGDSNTVDAVTTYTQSGDEKKSTMCDNKGADSKWPTVVPDNVSIEGVWQWRWTLKPSTSTDTSHSASTIDFKEETTACLPLPGRVTAIVLIRPIDSKSNEWWLCGSPITIVACSSR